jgi:hypothetical protein
MFLLIQSDRHTVNSEIIEMFHYCGNTVKSEINAFIDYCDLRKFNQPGLRFLINAKLKDL